MDLGVYLAPGADVDDVPAFAQAAEALGFAALWLPEHPVMPHEVTSPFPGVGDEIPAAYGRLPDPIVMLAAAAARTTHLKLATGVCLVGLRDPLVFAKEVATLDQVSNGRVVLGVGAGWLREEFEIITGDAFANRWARTVDAIRALTTLWSGVGAYTGPVFSFPQVRSQPGPKQRPRPPVFVGGSSDRALRAVVEVADGWLPVHADTDGIARGRAKIDELARRAGRAPDSIEIFSFGGPDRQRTAAELDALAAHGVGHAVVWVTEDRGDPHVQLEELGALTGSRA